MQAHEEDQLTMIIGPSTFWLFKSEKDMLKM